MLRAMQRDERCVYRVLRPAIGRCAQHFADFASNFSGANGSHYLHADGMLFRCIGMTDRLKRVVGSVARALDDRFPCRRVRILEAGKQAYKGIPGAVPDPFVERDPYHLAAAALKDFGVGHDLAYQSVAFTDRPGGAAIHALTRLAALVAGWVAFRIQGQPRCFCIDNQTTQVVSGLTWNEYIEYGAGRAGSSRCVDHLLFGS